MNAFEIQSVTHQRFELELNEPFGIASGTQERAEFLLVRVALGDGTVGLGEAAPLPAYNGETVSEAEQAVRCALPSLQGADVRSWRDLCQRLSAVPGMTGAARCGLEMALLDALTQRLGISLFHWFGGAQKAELETDVTLPIGSVTRAEEAAREWWGRGFRSLKIKVGRGEHDCERVLAVSRAVPDARLLLDANSGFTEERAIQLIRALADEGVRIDLFEQPVPRGDFQGLRRVRDTGVRIALDESIVSASDVLEAERHLGSDCVVNVKLMKAGILEAAAIVSTAKAAGMGLMIGGMVESSLAMTTSSCFAAGLGGFEFVDLDTHLFLEHSPFVGGLEVRGATLHFGHEGGGHGVRL